MNLNRTWNKLTYVQAEIIVSLSANHRLLTRAKSFFSLCEGTKRYLLNRVNLNQEVFVSHQSIEMVSTVEDFRQICLSEVSQKLHFFLVTHGVGAVVEIPATFLKVLKLQYTVWLN